MNFLAHVFLSGQSIPLAIGNLIADQIKGKEINNYPDEVQKGIHLHRAIDHFTDSHPLFKACVSELFPVHRHYSRVIVDMYFDHFLAVHWEKFHELPLDQFTTQFYFQLEQSTIHFPEKTTRFIKALITYNWFEQYKSIDGLGAIMAQMDRRTHFHSNLSGSTAELVEKYTYFEGHFLNFMNPVIAFSKNKISEL
ncbi:ACP phosphodiesterase [Flavobacteriaceae bacterium]|nr:ACP phosphodiesterase [Flavobacteriaceae bacterium]MDA7797699.1 ACP phosphodiesterase [Flavobacteriaceae bacterium]MDA8947551.1 ACP phosphodiesterase [Flavobacteriaceae bacterium]MDB3862366.1 ACP phosphodiesterase [Flavobacteriaceae bacterium]